LHVPKEDDSREETARPAVPPRVAVLHHVRSASILGSASRTDSPSTYALDVLTQTLQQCSQVNLSSFYNLQIVIIILYGMGYWSLLVVVVWTLTSMLRERLDRKWKLSRAIRLTTVVFMGLLTCVNIGLQCYHLWLNTMDGLYSGQPAFFEEQLRIGLAYWVLYLASILVAGAFVLLAMQPMRSKHTSGGVSLFALCPVVSCWHRLSGATRLHHPHVRFAERLVSHYHHRVCQTDQQGAMGVDR
jgi:hypothetical protein